MVNILGFQKTLAEMLKHISFFLNFVLLNQTVVLITPALHLVCFLLCIWNFFIFLIFFFIHLEINIELADGYS